MTSNRYPVASRKNQGSVHRSVIGGIRTVFPVFLSLLVLPFFACENAGDVQPESRQTIQVGTYELNVRLAIDDGSRRSRIPQSAGTRSEPPGRLYLFPHALNRMYFDAKGTGPDQSQIAFLDANGHILSIHDHPDEQKTVIHSSEPVSRALEVAGNWFEKKNVEPGTRVVIPDRFLSAVKERNRFSSIGTISIGGSQIRVEFARRAAERHEGLQHRRGLRPNHGMLFVFSDPEIVQFHMRNTLIPLDIAYIRSDGTILQIHRRNPLDDTSIPSEEPVQYVLETEQGWFQKHGIKEGDRLTLEF